MLQNLCKKKRPADIPVAARFDLNCGKENVMKVYESATDDNIIWEYSTFLKTIPNTIPLQAQGKIMADVNRHLNIYDVKERVRKRKEHNLSIKYCNKTTSTPILEALSAMLGYSLIIIAPPTSNCLYCKKSLTENNEPTQVQLHTRLGTNIATKYSLRCRNCKEARQHTGSLFGPSHDMHYHPTKYGNNMDGYKEYPDSYQVTIIKATNSAYVDELFAKQYF